MTNCVNGYGCVYEVPRTEPNSVIKGTVTAGAIGGTIYGAGEYGLQYFLKKNPEYLKTVRKSLNSQKNELKAETDATAKVAQKAINSLRSKFINLSKGKIDYKAIGKSGLRGFGIVGGIYLGYRAIKGLFGSNSEKEKTIA